MSLPTALSYLTVLRLPGRRTYDLRKAVVWFPLVGLAMGALLALFWMGALRILPRELACVLTLAFWIWLTGGVHLDGLADTSDALLSWRSRERMLSIMADPQIGSLGVLSILLVLATKGIALFVLPDARAAAALICAPVFGRSAQVVSTCFARYAKPEGVASTAFLSRRRFPRLIVSLIFMAACLQLGWQSAILLVVGFALLVAFLISRITRLLGGMTGDTLGAMTEIVEAWALVGAAVAVPGWLLHLGN